MSRIPCNVNKDLLPLYVDDVCSEESKCLVEEHLSECVDCQDYYGALKEEISKETVKEDKESIFSEEQTKQAQVSVIKGIKKQISNKHVRTVGMAVAAALLFVFVFEGLNGSYVYSALRKFPLFDTRPKLEDMEVTELYQLKNGYLYITVEMDAANYTVANGNLNEVIGKDGFTGDYEGNIFMYKSLWNNITEQPRMQRCTFIYPLSAQIENEDGEKVMREDSAIYLEGKGDKRQTIWKQGQAVEKAPETIEEIAEKEIAASDAADAYSAAESDEEYSIDDREGRAYVIMWDAKD